jgi:voltage-gated potassium channel
MLFRVKSELGRVRGQVSVALGMAILLIIFGTWMFQRVMDITWSESFYFTIVTLTTVGYGDVTPETDYQRAVVALFVLIGVTIFVTTMGIIGVNVIEKRQQKLADKISRRTDGLRERIAKLELSMAQFKANQIKSKDTPEPSHDEEEVS